MTPERWQKIEGLLHDALERTPAERLALLDEACAGDQAMRRILVEHARGHTRAKRGGDARKVSLDEAATLADGKAANMVALDDALKSLAEFDPRKSQIVELRYFGGLNIEETAEVIGVSPATVKREWTTAKIWLHREVTNASGAH